MKKLNPCVTGSTKVWTVEGAKSFKDLADANEDVVGKETAAIVMDKVEQTCGEALSGLCNIKVLGSGCKNCHNLLEAATQAVDKLGLPVKVEYVTDMAEVAKYGGIPAYADCQERSRRSPEPVQGITAA